jgi:hypothetical protein
MRPCFRLDEDNRRGTGGQVNFRRLRVFLTVNSPSVNSTAAKHRMVKISRRIGRGGGKYDSRITWKGPSQSTRRNRRSRSGWLARGAENAALAGLGWSARACNDLAIRRNQGEKPEMQLMLGDTIIDCVHPDKRIRSRLFVSGEGAPYVKSGSATVRIPTLTSDFWRNETRTQNTTPSERPALKIGGDARCTPFPSLVWFWLY